MTENSIKKIMRRHLLVVSMFLLVTGAAAFGQDSSPPDISKIPTTAAKAAGFEIDGWKVEETKKGDLNGDGAADAAITLKNKDGQRALVVALADGGNLKR